MKIFKEVLRKNRAALLVFAAGMQMEALPLSYLAGWIGMLAVELPLLNRTIRKYAS